MIGQVLTLQIVKLRDFDIHLGQNFKVATQ